MFARLFRLSAALAVGAVLATSSAEAVTVPIAPGGGPYVANTTDEFTANPIPLGSEVSFTHDYKFTGVALLGSQAVVSVHLPFPLPGQPGIQNLTISWLDTSFAALPGASSALLTNALGQTLTFTFNYTFGLINDVVLRLDGKTLKSNNSAFYDLTVNFTGDRQNEVPLPPALILFGSALVGLTVLGRRKRQGATVRDV